MRVLVLILLASLCACSWFGARKPPPPNPTQLIVTGAPAGSLVFIDGAPAGTATVSNDHAQVLNVAAGAHKVEIHVGDTVVYREDTYVGAGERRVVLVLSGLTR